MPRPHPPEVRQRLFDSAREGLGAAEIASRLRLSERTARDLLGRFRAQPEEPPLAPDYSRCGRPRPASHQVLRQEVLLLRQQHQGWGAPRLRLELKRLHPGAKLPCTRTLQLWLEQ